MPRALTVLIAPDSFKGSLTSRRGRAGALARRLVARPARRHGPALPARRWRRGHARRPSPRPAAGSGRRPPPPTRSAAGPRPLAPLEDGARAVVELAEASGLSRVAAAERDAVAATSAGTGDVLRAALDAGVATIILGIGGSATTDGGAGLLRALRCRDGSRRGGVRPRGSRSTPGRRRSRRRVRRHEPAPRADGGGRRLRPAEGRHAVATSSTWTPARRVCRPAGGGAARASATRPAPARPAGSGSGCWRSQDRFRSFALRPGWTS